MKTLLNKGSLVFDPPGLGCVLSLPGLPGGASKIYDRSPYGNHGTITGATWKRLPSGLWYLDFDGTDDEVDCGTDTSLRITTGAVSAWIYNEGDTSKHRSIITYGDGTPDPTGDGFCFRLITTTGNLGVYVQASLLDSSYTPASSTWLRVTVVFTDSDVLIYVNGAEEYALGSARKPEWGGIGTEKCKVGEQTTKSRDFLGRIALPRIVNSPPTALEEMNSFNREKHLFGVW